ncbi:MAG: minor capsid protein [Eggerthellaceae bacterium]|nr:minor capsid protein [Eggerthellaceae bacterium]
MDAANKWTDEQLAALEKRMAKAYDQASREMQAKQKKLMAEYSKERSQRLKALDDTDEAREAYEAWCKLQVSRADWMNSMVTALAKDATRANQKAVAMANDSLPTIYAENANYAAYSIDRAAGVNTMFTLVDQDTVRVLMKEDPQLLPKPSVNVPKDVRWNKQKLTSAITQGVLQGESIQDIAKRIKTVVKMDQSWAENVARLAVTSAENQGRVSSYKRAQELGIKLKQEWVATMDGRTRHSHRMLDGEKVEVGEKFSNGLRFPGDPWGPGEEIWGCRCTLVAAVDSFETDDAQRWSKLSKGVSYEEWKTERVQGAYTASAGLRVSGGPSSNKEWLKQFEPEVATIRVGGEKIYQKVGTPNSCSFPETLPDGYKYEDADLFHTHTTPISGTFSDIDIDTTARTYCASHTVNQILEDREYKLIRTESATKESAEKLKNDYITFYLRRKTEAEYALWEAEYEQANKPFDDVGRRRVLKELQPVYDEWFEDNAANYGYIYKNGN